MLVIEPNQEDSPRSASLADLDGDLLAGPRQRARASRLSIALGALDGGADLAAVGADRTGRAVNDDLLRVGAVAEASAVNGLPIGRRLHRERILPAQPIPIGDVEGEREHVAAAL